MRPRWSLVLVLAVSAGLTSLAGGSGDAPQAGAGAAPAQGAAPQGAQGRGAAGPGAGGGQGANPNEGADFLPRPPVVRLTPEQQQRLFLLPEGFKIDPVLADPLIEDPVAVSWDGNGRMYVVEMRSYMQDAEGSNSRAPVSRISRHEDTNGDGTYDKHTVFVDRMVLPRFAYPLEDGVILALETDNRDIYKYTDTNGDGVSDKKELFYAGAGRVTNMEWQPSGLIWAMDNWLYMTYNPFRLRILPGGKIAREETESNGGQWGTSQDNYGKVWFTDGGGELGPVNFQTPIVYGAYNLPDHFEPDFRVPWPAPGGIADMQGGMRRVKLPEGTLNNFTAVSGSEIYRGHRMPADVLGDFFFNEPVGRIVRRAEVVVTDGLTQLRNVYPKSEFLRSTDPLFRPVSIHTGPDGALYLADMYTGIIQDAQFVGAGSYLRRKIDQYALDKQHNWGRVWRITHEATPGDRTQPRMYSETPAQLVRHLEHANGWWRDTAQRLLVLKQDKSVVPALKTMAQTSGNQLARFHALWTLEGLGGLDAALARELMKSPDAQIRIQAIRASETLFKAGDKTFANDYRAMVGDADPNVTIQAMLTLNLHKVADSAALIRTTIDTSAVRGVKELGEQMLRPGASQGQRPSLADTGAGGVNLSVAERRVLTRGESAYRELCFSCHGADGKGAPMAGATDGMLLAPPIGGSARITGHRDYVIKVLLHGMTGPLDGVNYGGGGVMVPMGTNTDEWIADVASYVRNSFGNSGTLVTADQVAAVRKSTTRRSPWTFAELDPTIPKSLANRAQWKALASHNEAAVTNPIAGTGRWDTGIPQAPGQWYQVELPDVTTVAEVQIETAPVPAARGGGPGGRAGAAGAGAPGAVAGGAAGAGRGAAGVGAPAGGAAPAAAGAGAPAPAGAPAAGQAAGRQGGFGGGRGAALPPARGPVGFSVQVSTNGTTWGTPVATGAGATPLTTIPFRPVPAKFIRITQTGTTPAEYWAIGQIRVYQVAR